MNRAFLSNHNADFQNSIKFLKDLSAPNEHEQENVGNQPVLENCEAADLDGIDFDSIRNKWYPGQCGRNVPCSVDALIFQRRGIYLIEFKSGRAEQGNLLRKVYDSVMMLSEHDNFDYTKSRQNITYIVVSADLDSFKDATSSIMRRNVYGTTKNLWDDERIKKYYDHWHLCPLEDVLVNKVYCMPPDMFNQFVRAERWI